jgi:hypothetical protein
LGARLLQGNRTSPNGKRCSFQPRQPQVVDGGIVDRRS